MASEPGHLSTVHTAFLLHGHHHSLRLRVLLALPWLLVAIPVAIAAWLVEARWRTHRIVHPRRYRTAAEEPFPAAGVPVIEPYRVTYTSKAEHIETRRYETGRTETVDTRTGERVPDPFATF
ncbi:MAG: hypothetical protein M0Z95_22325 [Actinomycetota bacterium]|nr:hypothetical protein [Actinomycetota bacterium]